MKYINKYEIHNERYLLHSEMKKSHIYSIPEFLPISTEDNIANNASIIDCTNCVFK